ncbi:MAG: glutamate-5-semialdehyde dehydrogenase [Bdellovibrionales bacterium]|nr:glutamate-5-semialdehyde dehydrogenase [Bdellovibrionales bacterium]
MRKNEVSDIREQLKSAKQSSQQMALLNGTQRNDALKAFAELIHSERSFLKSENQKDLEANHGKIADSIYQRLELTDKKIDSVLSGISDLVRMEDPIGKVQWERDLALGPHLKRVTVPLGVIGIVFESRPDVNPQVLSLIMKSGNAVVLKGGSEAANSNRAFQDLVDKLNSQLAFLPQRWAQIIQSREDFREMLKHDDCLDLVIPRGSNQLVQSVMASTKAPVLGHADGICHIYVHPSAPIEKSVEVVINSKVQYPSACNAVETLLVDELCASRFLNAFRGAAENAQIELRGCAETQKLLSGVRLATDEDWKTEYGEKVLSIRVVKNVAEAIEHISKYGSHHTDAILSTDEKSILEFQNGVDSACVFVNASTRFADGYRFGMGAEVGISTSKTHARGPVGIEGLVSYKYILEGEFDQV